MKFVFRNVYLGQDKENKIDTIIYKRNKRYMHAL